MPRRMNRECNQVRHAKAHGIQAPTADHPSDVALEERGIIPERTDETKNAREPGGVPSRLEGLLPYRFLPAQRDWLWQAPLLSRWLRR
jgi:hypothetical protein